MSPGDNSRPGIIPATGGRLRDLGDTLGTKTTRYEVSAMSLASMRRFKERELVSGSGGQKLEGVYGQCVPLTHLGTPPHSFLEIPRHSRLLNYSRTDSRSKERWCLVRGPGEQILERVYGQCVPLTHLGTPPHTFPEVKPGMIKTAGSCKTFQTPLMHTHLLTLNT